MKVPRPVHTPAGREADVQVSVRKSGAAPRLPCAYIPSCLNAAGGCLAAVLPVDEPLYWSQPVLPSTSSVYLYAPRHVGLGAAGTRRVTTSTLALTTLSGVT